MMESVLEYAALMVYVWIEKQVSLTRQGKSKEKIVHQNNFSNASRRKERE